jgi:hypothetical protein
MHAAGEGPAQHHAALPVEAHTLELGAALLAMGGHLADPDLVADHLHGLATLRLPPAKQSKG